MTLESFSGMMIDEAIDARKMVGALQKMSLVGFIAGEGDLAGNAAD